MGPAALLNGRNLGQDFSRKDGWSMYHGATVPGFPAHPHRGFETVTIVRQGMIDHSDSLGATARFSAGDVQWLTAGKGIVHCEMFPLTHTAQANPLKLFQIWLNMLAKNKMAEPHFTMFWHEAIPRLQFKDDQGRSTDVVCIAGQLDTTHNSLPPPPKSWASEVDSELAIYTLKMAPGALWVLPAARHSSTLRQVYLFKSAGVRMAGQAVPPSFAVQVQAHHPLELENGSEVSEMLVLQGKPIGEPVAQQGPFVMSTQAEVRQAFSDYRRTQFGGWPWAGANPVHPREKGRFA
jgi:quercetin 2,3-dioxygenase